MHLLDLQVHSILQLFREIMSEINKTTTGEWNFCIPFLISSLFLDSLYLVVRIELYLWTWRMTYALINLADLLVDLISTQQVTP